MPRETIIKTLRSIIRTGLVSFFAIATMWAGTLEVWATSRSADRLSAEFTICGERRRVNCVVDGDTFWFRRQKIRIADIDTPELSEPRCEAERVKAEAAKQRLLTLLNEGRFSIFMGGRDTDSYGRKLRTVIRQGRSIGATLVEEGLARTWEGRRQPWCD